MLKRLFASLISLWLLSLLLPNVTYSSWVVLGLAGVAITLTQTILQPVLKILLLPITIITLGMFNSVINVVLLWLVTAVVPGFHIDPLQIWETRLSFFFSLIVVSFGLSLVQTIIIWIISALFKR